MFYSADNLQTKDEQFAIINGFNDPVTNTAHTQRFAYLKNGQWLTGKGDSWVSTASATTW